MDDGIETLRALIQRSRPFSRSDGFPAEVQSRVLPYVQACRRRGEAWGTIADRIGLNRTTVRAWVLEQGGSGGDLVPVVAVPEPVPPVEVVPDPVGLVLVSPRGWRLEGLGLTAALSALEQLG